MNTNKASIVKQSYNVAEGCGSQKVLFQPNMRKNNSPKSNFNLVHFQAALVYCL